MPALAACQALLVMNTAMMVSIGTLAADTLATQKFLVTLPATAYIVGGGLAAMPISLLMKRRGRRAGFMIGCFAGILGGTLAAIAVALHNFWLLCGAALVSGIYNGAGGFYRFAAADTASATLRSRAISLVLAGGIVGGVLGPESSKFTRDWFGPLFLGSFVSLILLATIALAVVRRLELPMLSEEERRGPTRNLAAIMRQPVFNVAALSGAIARTFGDGGLASSTLLSLVFVPAVFAVMDDIAKAVWRIFGRFVGPTEGEQDPIAPPLMSQGTQPRRLPAAAE